MKNFRSLILIIAAISIGIGALAQVESGSGVVRKRDRNKRNKTENSGTPQVTERMQSFYEVDEPHDADLAYMRQIYRQLDLTKDSNAPLYFPEDIVDGQENLFRIIMRLVVSGEIPAYEYLDGREVFTDQYKIKVGEMLNRFSIYYTEGSGSTEKNPKYVIEEADVPTNEVLNYYIIEKWEFDRRSNQMKTRVQAICPVLNRSGDFGGEAKYPMFWVKFESLRPYLAQQYIFVSDDNNLPQYSIDDFFNIGMYDGEIYKTRNLRNLSMSQMYPDPDDLKRAQDSIDNRLRTFDDHLWVPTREEFLAQKEREVAAAQGDSTVVEERGETPSVAPSTQGEGNPEPRNKRSDKKKKKKKTKVSSSSSSSNSNAARSVRRRKK